MIIYLNNCNMQSYQTTFMRQTKLIQSDRDRFISKYQKYPFGLPQIMRAYI